MNAYLKTIDQKIQDFQVYTRCREVNGITAVYLKGFSNQNLDPDFGAGIDIEIPDVISWMANYRKCEFWCSPQFGSNFSDVNDETQGLIYRKQNGSFGAILPVVSEKYKCVLVGGPGGKLTARLFSWYSELKYCDALAFVCAEGDNPYTLVENCAETALQLLGTGVRMRKQRRYPEIFEYLGWCSWDALQIRVNEEDLVRKCREFRDKDIPVKWAIIDDMWGEVRDFYDMEYQTRDEMFRLMHSSKLYSFEADPRRFPNGLKGCIDKMKAYDITVGMWHPTTGYWVGIDPEGDIYRDCKDYLIRTANGMYIHSYEQDKAYLYYSKFHDFLRKCGAEFVKIDNQSMTRRFYKGLAPVGEVARSFHNAIEASVGQHFDNAMINCMGTASEDMWNRTVSPVSRCSGDFQPENSEWFVRHILQCSYNTLIQGQFYYCDWDMWWTDDGQALRNSVLRAISGGPIYVSDMLERSNRDVLMPLVTNDGRILRCDRLAVPTVDCLTVDPTASGQIFKLQNMSNGCGILAAFNLSVGDQSEKPAPLTDVATGGVVSGTISPADVDGLLSAHPQAETFAVYEHFSRELQILGRKEAMELRLQDINDFRLYVIAPIVDGFAVIGRTDKFISPATVKEVRGKEVELTEAGEYAIVVEGKLVIRRN